MVPYSYDLVAAGILSGLIKILLAISLIGSVIGIAMYIREVFSEKETVNNNEGVFE